MNGNRHFLSRASVQRHCSTESSTCLHCSNTDSATKLLFLGDGLRGDEAARDVEGNIDAGLKVRHLAPSNIVPVG